MTIFWNQLKPIWFWAFTFEWSNSVSTYIIFLGAFVVWTIYTAFVDVDTIAITIFLKCFSVLASTWFYTAKGRFIHYIPLGNWNEGMESSKLTISNLITFRAHTPLSTKLETVFTWTFKLFPVIVTFCIIKITSQIALILRTTTSYTVFISWDSKEVIIAITFKTTSNKIRNKIRFLSSDKPSKLEQWASCGHRSIPKKELQ